MNRTETKKIKKLDFQNIYVDLRNRELNNKKINNCFFYFLTPKKSVIVNVCVWVSIRKKSDDERHERRVSSVCFNFQLMLLQ